MWLYLDFTFFLIYNTCLLLPKMKTISRKYTTQLYTQIISVMSYPRKILFMLTFNLEIEME